MKSLNRWAAVAAIALAAWCAPLAAAWAQGSKAVAIVSIASVKENLADIAYITRAAGMSDYGDTARFFASALAAGIDKDRPVGMFVVPKDSQFHAVAFLPLEPNGLATILKVHKDQLGEPKDAGNGIKEVGKNQTVFIKEQGGWAFVSEDKAFLADLPQDPVALLGDLPKTYNVAAKLMVQNIPVELRQMAIDQIKIGMERLLDSPAARGQNLDREQARNLSGVYVKNLEKLLNEADDLLVGLAIDEAAKRIALDISFSAKEGTSLAGAMALQTNAKTNFSGLAVPASAMTMTLASKISPEDIQQIGPAMAAARAQWAKIIDDRPDIPADKREPIKAALNQLFDIVQKNAETGKMDSGASIVLLPKSLSFVVGGSIADGSQVEKLLKTVADIGRDIPNFPDIKLNAGKMGDLTLHRLTCRIPNAQAEAREILGEPLEVLFAVGPKSLVAAGGKDAPGLLKRAIDQSLQQREKSVLPFELTVSLTPILKFIQSMDDNPIVTSMLAATADGANDRIAITSQPAARSSTTRIEIQEGVIRAGGAAAKAAGAGRNR